jgi:hypothetical protein
MMPMFRIRVMSRGMEVSCRDSNFSWETSVGYKTTEAGLLVVESGAGLGTRRWVDVPYKAAPRSKISRITLRVIMTAQL